MYCQLKIELLKCWLCQSILSDAQKERTDPGDDDAVRWQLQQPQHQQEPLS